MENTDTKSPIEDRIKLFEEEFKALLEKYHFKISVVHEFPQYKILPDEVKLALSVLARNGMQSKVSYEEVGNANI